MNTKKKVLLFLENNKGNSISGEQIALKLGVSRTAVWKAIKSLEQDGYGITASTNKGYCLSETNDIVSAQSIQKYLKGTAESFNIITLKTVDSTNNYAKKLAQEGAPQGTVVIADEQTAGKGRLGRRFYSPSSTGIYISIILRPSMQLDKSLLITTSTAVAVSEAIESVTAIKTSIKWVNDIFAMGKKLCGILCEASIDFETKSLEYAIVGIGINVTTKKEDFPQELSDIATSIYTEDTQKAIRSKLIAEVLNNLSIYCIDNLGDKEIVKKYKERSFLIGEDIYIIEPNGDKTDAKAIDIDENAHLIVKLSNGTIRELNSGEVSVRKK